MRTRRRPCSGPAARVRRGLAAALLSAASLVHTSAALNFTSIPPPNLRLDGLGRVAFAGDFDALSLYEFQGQSEAPLVNNGSNSILARFPSGAFTAVLASDASIKALTPFELRDGTLAGVVVGGNFTSLGGIETQGIALWSPDTGAVTPLPGLSGTVNALYCDKDASTVYVGGSFSGGNSTNAIVWTTNWTNMPFAGFNGPVYDIVKTAAGNIVFAGSFDGLGNTTRPSEPDQQPVPIAPALVSQSASSGRRGFDDPRNVICKTGDQDGAGNTWLLPDNAPGFWQARFEFGFQPTKLRLYNTQFEGRGTREWRFTQLPTGGIMNFSYVDADGQERFCESRCPLRADTDFQDFKFVNLVGMNEFRLDISDFYGPGAGLSGVELFQDDIYTYAVEPFNDPTCTSSDAGAATADTTGTWLVTPSGDSTSQYLTANLQAPQISAGDAKVVFRPNIKESGNYSVTIFTPGCRQDNTCFTRGRVNVTGDFGASGTQSPNQPLQTELFQTNEFDKYDQIFSGFIDAASPPSVTLAPSPDQVPPLPGAPLVVVAQRVRFELTTNTTAGGLNGLFEFNPNQADADTDFSASAINRAGMDLDRFAVVNVVREVDGVLYAGGNFTTPDFQNVMALRDGNLTSLPGRGLDSEVNAMLVSGRSIYVGGNFTNLADGSNDRLGGVAVYSTGDGTWQPLGAGVNGVVKDIVPVSFNLSGSTEDCVAVSGTFDRVRGFADFEEFEAADMAVWVPSRGNWLRNTDVRTTWIQGRLMAQTNVPGYPPVFAGSVQSQSLTASGGVAFAEADEGYGLSPWPFTVQRPQPQPQQQQGLRKRAVLTEGEEPRGILSGLIVVQDPLNLTIMGGRFNATTDSGETVSNLIFINGTEGGTAVNGLRDELPSNTTFLALANRDSTLFAGGIVSGRVGNRDVSGVVIYDLAAGRLADAQPDGLDGGRVVVSAIAVRPDSSDVFVGGQFETAGSLSCPSICVFDAERMQWNTPGTGISGNVSSMTWTSSSSLVISGSITVGGNRTTLATYDHSAQTFTEFAGAGALPGPVAATCPADDGGSQWWVAGSATDGGRAFIQRYDGERWLAAPELGEGTLIQGLQIFPLTEEHDESEIIDTDQALLVLGRLNIPGYGNASSALFNGTTYTPFIITSTAGGEGGGAMAAAFVQNPQNFFQSRDGRLAVGFVVLIALAISLGLMMLIIVAGIIAERLRRRREGYQLAPTSMPSEKGNVDRIPPEQLFGGVAKSNPSPPGGRL